MCAIAGILNLFADEYICADFLESMKRRGPDGNGCCHIEEGVLLHSRLAIIDPSGGAQPMECEWQGKRYVIVYNGELYNTDEIRVTLQHAGHSFLTKSDTEVVLKAFVHWGEESLQLLNGIFAFAVWNNCDRCLFIARDRMGVKPFFYTQHNGGFIFSSEIKSILKYPSMRAQLDANGVAQLLLLGPGRMPGSGVFKGIYELEPGCCGWYMQGKLKINRYWKLTDRVHMDSLAETAEHIRYLVVDSIQRQMVSDVPIGTFLSGGLDSSLISAVCAREMARNNEYLKTFSLGYCGNEKYFKPGKFQPNADTDFISTMEVFLEADAQHSQLTPEQLVFALAEAVEARDLPGMADVDSSLLVFCGDIRRHVKVALSGECADEIFGGYPWYRDPRVRESDGFPWAQNTVQRANLLPGWVRSQVDPTEFIQDIYRQTINQADVLPDCSAFECRMKQMVHLNYTWFMQTLLDRKDRMSMYNGLEVRVPFCDYRIAEYMYAVPWEFKDHGNYEKGLLRYAMQGFLPDEILWRKKSPYPKTHDPKYLTIVRSLFNEVLQKKDARIHAVVDMTPLSEMLNADMSWPWYGQLMQTPQTIAYILQIHHWLEHYKIELV